MKQKKWIGIASLFIILAGSFIFWYIATPVQVNADFSVQQEASDYVVLDNRTNLMWEVKTDTNKTDTYTWEQALVYCETTMDGYAGYDDWRLPDIKELASIADRNRLAPAIDTSFFPNTQSGLYWSSTTYVSSTSNAWIVSFYDGDVGTYSKANTYYCRCTR